MFSRSLYAIVLVSGLALFTVAALAQTANPPAVCSDTTFMWLLGIVSSASVVSWFRVSLITKLPTWLQHIINFVALNWRQIAKDLQMVAAASFFLVVAACSTASIQAATSELSAGITSACKDVAAASTQASTTQAAGGPLALKGGAAATLTSLQSYAAAACPLGEVAASLAQNSATLEWLGNLQGQITTTAPPATPAAPSSMLRRFMSAVAHWFTA